MQELTASVRIAAPVEYVFAFVDDWRNTPRYIRGLEDWEPIGERAQGLGARFRAGMKVGPSVLHGEMVVREHVPNERIVFETVSGPSVVGIWRFDAEGDATVVTLTNRYELPGGFAGRMAEHVIASRGRRDHEGSLSDLKRLVESG